MIQFRALRYPIFNILLGQVAFPLRSQGIELWVSKEWLNGLWRPSIYLGACTSPLGERLPPSLALKLWRHNLVILDIGSCLSIQVNSLPFPRRPITIPNDIFSLMPLTMMTLVTNITHTRVPAMYKCLTTSLAHTHLLVASLTLFG